MLLRAAIAAVLLLAARKPGDITEFELSSEGHRPQAIAPGPDGNLWVSEVIKHKIVKITPAGQITEFPVPSKSVGVIQGIAAGPDGAIWFTSREENMIRRMTTAGEFKIPSGAADKNSPVVGSWPREIAQGPDGNLWFAEMGANKIARITPKGEITEFPLPTPDSKPYCVVSGPDKALWFTESGVDKIGRIDPKSGTITEFPLPAAKSFSGKQCKLLPG